MNVPLQPARVPQTPHPERVLRSCHDCAARRGKNQPEGWPLQGRERKMGKAEHNRSRARYIVPLRGLDPASFSLEQKSMFSKAFLLTCLRTLAPASPFFSHTSQKHPGVVWAPSNSCLLCSLRTPYLTSSAHTPYPWPIALRFSRCHNELSGQLPAGSALCARRFLEGGPAGQETF